MTAGAWPVRMRQSSSRNCTSRVRCRPFATPQWPRTRASRAAASAGPVAFGLHPDQAAQAGPRFGVRDSLAEAGTAQHGAEAPLAAAAVALDGLAAVRHGGREDAPLGIVGDRLYGGLRVQPAHQAQVGVAGGCGVAQGQPQPESGPVVVRAAAAAMP